MGGVVTVKQPGRRGTDYTIDELADGRRFRWVRDRGGVRQSADHIVVPGSSQRCSAALEFAKGGVFGTVLGRLGASKIRRMVDLEAASLKTRAESTPRLLYLDGLTLAEIGSRYGVAGGRPMLG